MALVIADRVRETTSSAGTGTITLTGAFSGFQPFSTIGNGNTTYYCIIDAAAGAWEVGIGTYTTAGNTLSRDTVLSSSNGGSLVVFAAGLKDVICTQPSERAVYAVGTDVVAENNAKVPNSLLANSGITFGSTAQALGSTVTALNGVSIGGSTAAAGNFTTLTTSSTVTLNGGVASGVAYLNGSKVLTTGSALTFDGTNLSNSGALRLTGGASSNVRFESGGSEYARIMGNGSNSLDFAVGGTTPNMSLTSTGLGIGTSSPSANTVSVAGKYLLMTDSQSMFGDNGLIGGGAADGNTRLNYFSGKFLRITSSTTEVARFDSSGNLGLGVTPSAWDSTFKAFESGAGSLNGGSFFVQNNGDYTASIATNLYFNAGWKYKNSAPAARYEVYQNKHQWFTAPSGTAGNAISFTQAMTLDASGNLGIGTSSPGASLHAAGAIGSTPTGSGFLAGLNGSFGQAKIYGSTGGILDFGVSGSDASARILSTNSGKDLQFYTNGPASLGERMRLDSSGNVGIGTSSPVGRLEAVVAADINIENVNTNVLTLTSIDNGGGYYYPNQGAGVAFRSGLVAGATIGPEVMGAIYGANTAQESVANGQLTFHTRTSGSVTEKMRLDSSGNLGLGVTPSAWDGSLIRAIQIGDNNASISSFTTGNTNSDFLFLNNNAFYTAAGWRYAASSNAAQYTVAGGEHRWSTAPSGTAGNAISFTQAMTLDASGNLGVGTTSPAEKLHVVGKIAVSGTNPSIRQTVQNAFLDLCGGTTVGTDPSIQIAGSTTTSDANKIFYNANTHVFRTSSGGTTYATIDTSGNLLVGTTSASISNTSGARFIDAGRTLNIVNTTATNPSIVTNQVGFGGTTVSFRLTNIEKGYIETSSTSVAYVTSSDYRLKESIAPMQGALARVAALKPVTYKWKIDGSDGEGFIAHELQEVCPDCVTGEKDAVDSKGKPKYQGIDASFLVATLTAAIQEQQAIITALTARLDAANL